MVVGEHVVFASADGRIYILDLASGEERWSYDLGSDLGGSLAVAGGWIYAVTLDGRLSVFGPRVEESAGSLRKESAR